MIDVTNECLDLLLKQQYYTFAKLASKFKIFFVDEDIVAKVSSAFVISIGKKHLHLGDGYVSLLIRHELSHYVLNHFERMENRDSGVWNIAGDVELSNWYNKEDFEIIQQNSFLCSNPNIEHMDFKKYKEWVAEDIYEDLIKNQAHKSNIASIGEITEILPSCVDREMVENIKSEIASLTQATKQETFNHSNLVLSQENAVYHDIESEFIDYIKPIKKRGFQRENIVHVDLIMPSKYKQKSRSLTLHLFRDVSGSMTLERTRKATELMHRLTDNKYITVIHHTFSNNVDSDIGNGTNYDAIVQYCNKLGVTDLCVITDDDHNNVVTHHSFERVFVISVVNSQSSLKLNSKIFKTYSL